MPSRPALTGALLVAALGAAASEGACRRAPGQVVYDFARRLPVADRWASRDVLMFGTPATEPHQAEGFYRDAVRPTGDGFVWARQEAELSLSWPRVEPREAVVELAPYSGVKSQAAEVRLNGTTVAHFNLNDTRHRYLFPLPPGAQTPGENRLRFAFAATASPASNPGSADRRQLAAAFYSLTVAPAGDGALEDLLRREAPAPFGVAESAGVPTLVQLAPSSLRYALTLPERAELRFTPDLHPASRAAGASLALRITLESAAGQEKELWSAVLRARDAAAPQEVALRLPDAPGQVVRLGLHASPGNEPRVAWAAWKAPRLLGRSATSMLVPGPPSSAQADEGGDLRGRLRGANVLLVILDAARARHVGCYGYTRPTTPELDRIASEGVVFERAYTPAVYTLGAMSSLWTSQYPDRHHAEVSYADRLPADRLTLAEALSAGGIHTAGFVANPMAGTAFGFERGFREFRELFALFPDLGSRAGSFRRVLPGWLKARGDGRFFAYVHFREPHFPYDPPAPFDTRFGPDLPLSLEQRRQRGWYTDVNQGRQRPSKTELDHLVRLYDGNLAYADRELGALREAMEAAGLWEKTVVIVTADHGEQLYEHDYISHSAQVYEDSVRVPLVVRFPDGKGPRGARVSGLVDLLDVAPTVLEVFGLLGPDRPRPGIQGRSLLPVVAGAPGKPAVVSRTVWERPVYAIRDERFKLVYDTRTGLEQLFDLVADPAEARDLAAADPLRTAYLRQSLLHWAGEVGGGAARAADRPAAPPSLTPGQCENMRSLGYVVAECGAAEGR